MIARRLRPFAGPLPADAEVSQSLSCPLRVDRGNGRARNAVGVEIVALVRKLTPCAGRPDGVLRPTEENRDLGDVERRGSILEHLWNTNVVHAWGSLVMERLRRR